MAIVADRLFKKKKKKVNYYRDSTHRIRKKVPIQRFSLGKTRVQCVSVEFVVSPFLEKRTQTLPIFLFPTTNQRYNKTVEYPDLGFFGFSSNKVIIALILSRIGRSLGSFLTILSGVPWKGPTRSLLTQICQSRIQGARLTQRL